jgi:hypothetical protein
MALSNAEKQRRWRERRNALAKQALAMAKTRGRRGRRARPINGANDFIRELYQFRQDYSRRLNAWRELAKFSTDDRDQLVHALHSVAKDLTLMAQTLG